MNTLQHVQGPGLKVIGKDKWYGSWGGCDICGTTSNETLIPIAVRFWDCDDGWKVGVLCADCGDYVYGQGPKEDDYAYNKRNRGQGIDVLSEVLAGDEDGIWAETQSGQLSLFDENE